MVHPTIMQRLTLLTAVPVLALILSSGILIWDSFGRYQTAIQSRSIMEATVAAGDLIHPLQIERGMSAGFIQSNGQRFADTLPGARTNADQKLASYKQILDAINIGSMPELKKSIEEARHKLDQLAGMRDQIGKHSLAAKDSSAFFTDLIASLADVMSTAISYNTNPEIVMKLLIYDEFVNAKENAGQERALTVPGFTSNKVEMAQYRNILSKIHKQDAYLDSLKNFASEQEKAALKAVLEGDASKDVQRMRNIMAERTLEGGFNVDPAEWFKRSTDRINGFYEVEQLLTKNINADVAHQLSASRTLLWVQLVLAVLVIAITVVVSIWVARSVNRPLNAVVGAAEYATAHDDFTRRIPEEGVQETVRVGQAINQLMEKFRTIILHATQSSERIADASGVLSTSSEQVNRSSAAQSDAASSVAAAVEEMSVSISETARNAQTSTEIVEKSSANTAQALVMMEDTVRNVNSIAALIRESDASVAQLDERSKQIGGIIQVIKDVADQTNLLALNAAIEAARAGEQGRGFAVVADEVRKLAERTSKATQEIATLIGDIQNHIGGTVKGMQRASAQVTDSLELVGKTETALHRMGDDSRVVAANVHSIADAIREQDAAIHQVAANIEKIAQMAEKNSTATASSSDTAVQLDRLSGELKGLVSRFKI